MKRLIVAVMLSLFATAACVGPNGVPAPQARNHSTRQSADTSYSTNQAPAPEPTTGGKAALLRKPPECASCNADMRRRLGNCGSVSSSCMAGCSGTDAMKTAVCQSGCQSQYAQCAQVASMPNDCPAYCAL